MLLYGLDLVSFHVVIRMSRGNVLVGVVVVQVVCILAFGFLLAVLVCLVLVVCFRLADILFLYFVGSTLLLYINTHLIYNQIMFITYIFFIIYLLLIIKI